MRICGTAWLANLESQYKQQIVFMSNLVRGVVFFVDAMQKLAGYFRCYSEVMETGVLQDGCVFQPPDYQFLQNLPDGSKEELYILICTLLWKVYQQEWKMIIKKLTERLCRRFIGNQGRHRVVPITEADVPFVSSGPPALNPMFHTTIRVATAHEGSLPMDGRGYISNIGEIVTVYGYF